LGFVGKFSLSILLLLLQCLFVTAGAADVAEGVHAEELTPAEQAEQDEQQEILTEIEGSLNGEPSVVVPEESTTANTRKLWTERVDEFEAALLSGPAEAENPDELFVELTALLRLRLHQFEMVLDGSTLRIEQAEYDAAELRNAFPDMPADLYSLPTGVVTVQQVHENLQALYAQRLRLFEHVSEEFYLQLIGNGTAGTDEVLLELNLIVLELHYQILRVPDVVRQTQVLLKRAPFVLVWFVVQLWLLILVFRWWRNWAPETLKRMQNYLLAIRPRSKEIMGQVRLLWYVDQVRGPLEWLVFFNLLFQVIDIYDLEFVTNTGIIIVRWIFFFSFLVSLVNAIVARGSGGITGEHAATRLKSFRLFAAWIVLLGLGLDLAEHLTGIGTFYSYVGGLFEILTFPVLLLQLGLWRENLFRRLQRVDHEKITEEEYAAQKGLRKYLGAATMAGYLFAAWLSGILLRRMERFNPGRVGLTEAPTEIDDDNVDQPIDSELRDSLINGEVDYTKYGRAERRTLVDQINRGFGGFVLVIGERGVGKDAFVSQVGESIEGDYLQLDCSGCSARDLEQQLASQLGLDGGLGDSVAVANAIEAKNVKMLFVSNLHLLIRPIVGGFDELQKLSDWFDYLPDNFARVCALDSYAWQYIKCAIGEQATGLGTVQLPAWTEEQIRELISTRCEVLELEPDATRVKVPTRYLDANHDTLQERNLQGIMVMVANLSGGNPSIAMRLFAECLRVDTDGTLFATLPDNADSRDLERAPVYQLLTLRVIAQAERITHEHLVSNLGYGDEVVSNALHVALVNGWIRKRKGEYTLTWPWFRTITRTLARQNLLAGAGKGTE